MVELFASVVGIELHPVLVLETGEFKDNSYPIAGYAVITPN